jgi:hypothetical protein
MKKLVAIFALWASFSSCDVLMHTASNMGSANPTNTEIIGGLKEALTRGVINGVDVLSAKDGFFGNDLIRILLPEEVRKVESAMRTFGFGSTVDNAIKALNEGAELATREASQVFVDAIKNMSFQDAMGILTGGNSSATNYLKSTTTETLIEKFRPIIGTSLDKVDATKYWGDVMSAYNMVSREKINPDLTGYVTERALNALFGEVEKQENLIRENPIQRTTDLLKKVFDFADRQKEGAE